MELPPFNLEDFTKWKTNQAIVKVRQRELNTLGN